MPVVINGSTGISGTDGSASTPAVQGTDTNTGVFFPAADTIAFGTNGTEDFRIGPAGQLGVQGANYGTSGQVLTSQGSAAAPAWATPGGGANVQTFTSSGTWTKPSGANFVMVEAWGGGGGGGGAGLGSSGSGYIPKGGTGGGGGAYVYRLFLASDLTSTVAVTVGAGGAGGVGNASDFGGTGSAGGNSSFGSYLTSYGGGRGTAGNAYGTQNVDGGQGGGVLSSTAPSITSSSTNVAGQFGSAPGNRSSPQSGGFAGGSASVSPANQGIPGNPGGSSYQGGAAGGNGGGGDPGQAYAGSAGGSGSSDQGGGGTAGAVGGGAGGAGAAGVGRGGSGGGGGGGRLPGNGGNGGAGGFPAGGGGGAGSALDSGTGGTGGAGGAGLVRVYTW